MLMKVVDGENSCYGALKHEFACNTLYLLEKLLTHQSTSDFVSALSYDHTNFGQLNKFVFKNFIILNKLTKTTKL